MDSFRRAPNDASLMTIVAAGPLSLPYNTFVPLIAAY